MTILWFFPIVSMNGEPTIFWGFPNEADCSSKRGQYAKNMEKVVRDITPCVGLPIKGYEK